MGTFTPQDPQPCRLLPQREQAAAPWRTLAQRFRSRIVEPPKNFIQRLLNAFYRTVADRAEARADAISAEAGRIRMQADSLRGLAQAKEQQAEGLEAEATRLLAEATEAREEAASLRTEADTFTAQARAAETLAAEHRALAENPPLAQIATHYLYDPEGRLLGEYDEAGQVEREYVYLDHLPLAQITGTAIAYIHTDHLGTPESLTDQDQALVWQAHHDPFGRATVATQAVEHHLRFPGQYFDAETGLHYNYFRDYDPSIGRYIQSDPIGLAGGINPYLYANANPLRYTDPTGEIVLVLPAIAPALTALGEAVAFVGSAALAGVVLSSAWDDLAGDVPDSGADARSDDKSKQCPDGSDDDGIDCDEWLDLIEISSSLNKRGAQWNSRRSSTINQSPYSVEFVHLNARRRNGFEKGRV